MPKKYLLICSCIILFLSMFQIPASAGDWTRLSSRIGPSDAVAVAAPDGKILFAENENEFRIPASTLKILTALVAFEQLGPDYRFATEFYLDGDNNLIIKGYGDPYLVSEEVQGICRILSRSINMVNDLVIDREYFEQAPVVPGTALNSLQPYDAPVGALCVNFNTVYFKKENNRFVSAEPQTPLLPTAMERINGMAVDSGRILLSDNNNELIRYAGELFRYFLDESGLKTRGTIRTGKVKSGDTLIYRHQSSFPLEGIVAGLMEYSNNFIANQLLLAAGAKAYGSPATLEKGVRAANHYARQVIGIDPVIVEGSGISRGNRMTAAMFMSILDAFEPHFELLKKDDQVYYKTGTLNGIRCRAGYIRAADGKMYRFALLVNTPGKAADPIVNTIRQTLNTDVAQKTPEGSAS